MQTCEHVVAGVVAVRDGGVGLVIRERRIADDDRRLDLEANYLAVRVDVGKQAQGGAALARF